MALSGEVTQMRIACVQYGNYTEARRLFAAGLPETYSGQRYTVDHFSRFVAGSKHLVISLHAEDHRQPIENGLLLGMSRPQRTRLVPERIQMRRWARQVIHELERFGPTHLLLRCNDVMGCELIRWANRRCVPVGIAIAVRFQTDSSACLQFCRLANHPNVTLVGNHNRVATQSMVDCGLDKSKAVAWDLPPTITPDDFPAKPAPAGGIRRFLFAGVVSQAKGATDLVAAIDLLRREGHEVELDLCGEGTELAEIRQHPGIGQGWLRCPGLVGNAQVVKMMRAADLVVVPSRHEFPEGLPFVIQESLAVRTPLLLSDHPVFTSYFREPHGVRFFRGGNAQSLAKMAESLIVEPERYAQMSRCTEAAWQSVRCPLMWHELLDQIKRRWTIDQGRRTSCTEQRELTLVS